MPGPVTLPSILPDRLLGDLSAIWRQNRHPVYNALGRQVGSYETLDALCQGQWFLLAGERAPPASQLYVSDFWGRRVPLSSQCVRAAKASDWNITQPQRVTPASAVKAVTAANAGAPAAPPPILFDPQPGHADAEDRAANVQLQTYALWGAIGLLGLSLITSGGRGRRR